MCYVWQNPTDPKEEVSLETLEKLPGGFDNVNVSGGEPTLRQDLSEIIDVLYPKGRIMEISSNGLNAEKILPIIKKHPNVKIRFSLEGDEITNNTIRGEKDGYKKKIDGLLKLKEAGGTDLGFAFVIQDENADQLVKVYEMTQKLGVELATSTLHNAWQFHKSDNYFYERKKVAQNVEGLITGMLKTNSVKNWFRAYLNLGLIQKILGHDRLIKCTAGTDFAFIDPWSDVYACNVRPDLKIGNLEKQSWEEIMESELTKSKLKDVSACQQNCWMVTTARTAMRSKIVPSFPKMQPLMWVLKNKLKVSIGKDICFNDYIDYNNIKSNPIIKRHSFLDDQFKKKLQRKVEDHYTQGEFLNQ
jgi:MoaA/NifB/PqqE/SkfB family radical SAM enzyme